MKLQRILWIQATIILLCGISTLTSCSNDDDAIQPADQVETALQEMSLREKVGQMFYVRPEALDTTIHWVKYSDLSALALQQVTDKMRGVNEKYPIGGIILYGHNIKDEAQLAQFIGQLRSLNGRPLLCIDEEGGLVARIANNGNFDVKKYESMGAIGATGDPQNAYECGNTIGTYLKHYDFDINFAPVADVNTNPENIVIGSRAFSDDPEVAATMVTSYLQGMHDAGIIGCIKHFPGHGDTKSDTHYGYAQSLKTWEEMVGCEMIPFKAGIAWGCQIIMTAHISVPNVSGSDVPSTMSSVVLQDKLRGELGYNNIICSDAMEMGAITQQYTCPEAVVGCIKAGVDIVLSPRNFAEGFDAVVAAVEHGDISEERINQSVRRILRMKRQTSTGIVQ
ncbi:MAG: glycoside hydrolase family 3 protein [Prevotella sp.]|nr:glycoside hydrolase family 3 protein [Prevotella sp.]